MDSIICIMSMRFSIRRFSLAVPGDDVRPDKEDGDALRLLREG